MKTAVAFLASALLLASGVAAVCVGLKNAREYRLEVRPAKASCEGAGVYAGMHWESNLRSFVERQAEIYAGTPASERWDPEAHKRRFVDAARGVVVEGVVVGVRARKAESSKRFRRIRRTGRFPDEGVFHLPEVASCAELPEVLSGAVVGACCDNDLSEDFLCGNDRPSEFWRLLKVSSMQSN